MSAYCEENYAHRIDLGEAAGIAGLQSSYFSTFFHTKVGVCFNCWLSLLRVGHAQELLRANDRPITSIARAVGFHNLTSFERTFKRCIGMTASQYRNEHRPC